MGHRRRRSEHEWQARQGWCSTDAGEVEAGRPGVGARVGVRLGERRSGRARASLRASRGDAGRGAGRARWRFLFWGDVVRWTRKKRGTSGPHQPCNGVAASSVPGRNVGVVGKMRRAAPHPMTGGPRGWAAAAGEGHARALLECGGRARLARLGLGGMGRARGKVKLGRAGRWRAGPSG
jgi:hypothetical protein